MPLLAVSTDRKFDNDGDVPLVRVKKEKKKKIKTIYAYHVYNIPKYASFRSRAARNKCEYNTSIILLCFTSDFSTTLKYKNTYYILTRNLFLTYSAYYIYAHV